MLTGIDARASPELLYTLARMGHGDEIVIADANFPATSTAVSCVSTEVINMPNVDAAECTDIVTGLMPLDGFAQYAALRMEIDSDPTGMGDVHKDVWKILETRKPPNAELSSLERQSFYNHARSVFAVVQTGESRPFGCFILRKGVIL